MSENKNKEKPKIDHEEQHPFKSKEKESTEISRKLPRRIGNTFFFCYKNGYPLFSIGPNWKFSLIVSTTLLFLEMSFIYYISTFTSTFLNTCGAILMAIQALGYFLTFVINPGTNPSSAFEERCEMCGVPIGRNMRVGHCKACDVCIEGITNHFTLIGKCIGKYNKQYFYTTAAATFGFILFMMISAGFLLYDSTKYFMEAAN